MFVECKNTTTEEEVMDARFNMLDNELAAKFGKRFATTSLVIGPIVAAESHPGAGQAPGQSDQWLWFLHRYAHQRGRGRR